MPQAYTVLASFCPSLPRKTKTPLLLKILVDCSGSMAGDSIRSAKEALHRVLAELNPTDYVSFSRFGDTTAHESRRLENCAPATIRRIAGAISRTDANLGGTEMRTALLSTFRDIIAPDDEKNLPPPTVLLITDGEIWETREVLAEAQRSGHRIFTVGVGSAPAETLHRELAAKTGGACELVSPNENAADAIVRMFHRLRTAATVDVQVDWGANIKPLWQSTLPRALYDGETVHLFAQFSTPPPRPPQLHWKAGNSAHTLSAQTLSTVPDDTLPRLAGAKQLDEATTDAQRKKLAMRYQLVSEQTNLFLVHVRAEADKAGSLPTLHQVPQMLAAAWGGMGTVRRGVLREFAIAACGEFAIAACGARSFLDASPSHSVHASYSSDAPIVCKERLLKPIPDEAPSRHPAWQTDHVIEENVIHTQRVSVADSIFNPETKLRIADAAKRRLLMKSFFNLSLITTDFTNIVARLAQLSASARVQFAARIQSIIQHAAATEEEFWAVWLEALLKQSDNTPPPQAIRLLRNRLNAIPPEKRQAIAAASDFISLCGGA